PNQTSPIDLLGDTWAASDDPVAITIMAFPAHGMLVYDPLTELYDYTPNAGYLGNDSFAFEVNDGIQNSQLTTVAITVGYSSPPVAGDKTVTVSPNDTISIVLLDSGTAADGGPLATSIVRLPVNGTLEYDSVAGTYDYSPAIDFVGQDSFTFVEND